MEMKRRSNAYKSITVSCYPNYEDAVIQYLLLRCRVFSVWLKSIACRFSSGFDISHEFVIRLRIFFTALKSICRTSFGTRFGIRDVVEIKMSEIQKTPNWFRFAEKVRANRIRSRVFTQKHPDTPHQKQVGNIQRYGALEFPLVI